MHRACTEEHVLGSNNDTEPTRCISETLSADVSYLGCAQQPTCVVSCDAGMEGHAYAPADHTREIVAVIRVHPASGRC